MFTISLFGLFSPLCLLQTYINPFILWEPFFLIFFQHFWAFWVINETVVQKVKTRQIFDEWAHSVNIRNLIVIFGSLMSVKVIIALLSNGTLFEFLFSKRMIGFFFVCECETFLSIFFIPPKTQLKSFR